MARILTLVISIRIGLLGAIWKTNKRYVWRLFKLLLSKIPGVLRSIETTHQSVYVSWKRRFAVGSVQRGSEGLALLAH